MIKLEKRFFKGMALRLDEPKDGAPILSGHIAVFNQLSEDLGGFKEKVAPGSFAETIRVHDIRALWNHNDNWVLGRNKAGTLELAEDAIGLAFRNEPPDTTWFSDGKKSLARGDVTGCSFGFYTEADEWATEADGSKIRTLTKITLVEVSPGVTFPAYPQTDVAVAVRSMQAWDAAHPGASPAGLRNSGQVNPAVVQIESLKRTLRLKALTS